MVIKIGFPYTADPREEACANCDSWDWDCPCESCKACGQPQYPEDLTNGWCSDYCPSCNSCSCETIDTHELECSVDDCRFCIIKHESKKEKK